MKIHDLEEKAAPAVQCTPILVLAAVDSIVEELVEQVPVGRMHLHHVKAYRRSGWARVGVRVWVRVRVRVRVRGLGVGVGFRGRGRV